MDIIERCSNYLSSGGLFNPEFADHDAVRDLVINCRDEIEKLRSVLRMWVKFWENDESIDINGDQWLAEEAMEETRKVLGVDIKQ